MGKNKEENRRNSRKITGNRKIETKYKEKEREKQGRKEKNEEKNIEGSEVIFRDSKIQKGYRVKIPKAIIDTLGLKEGEKIIIKFNTFKKLIIIEEEKENF